MPALACRGLSAGYQGRAVVRGLDFDVEEGEVLALLGPNGAGKTTVMLTLAGLLPPLAGSLTLAGQSVTGLRADLRAKAGLVLVSDDRALFTTLTARENLSLAERRGGLTIDGVVEHFPALRTKLDVKAGMLSGGEQQMLAVGRALVQSPKVLLLDEMSMGLAPVVANGLLAALRTIADDGAIAVVLVEQHVSLALEFADRVMVLAHGEVTLRDAAAELRSHRERLEQSYFGQATPA
jgi:branched-chain amino acid transport system ATP-binding protein